MNITRRLACAAALGAALIQPAFAQAPPVRIRGTVTSLTGDALVVHGRDGADTSITLAPDAVYRSIKSATLADIKPGALIGIVSSGPADKQVAQAIQIFIPGSNVRQGISGWDMLPNSTMTNAAVQGTVQPSAGGDLTVMAGDKAVHMTVAPDVSVGAAAEGSKADLTPGAKVVVFTSKDATGYTGHVVIAGQTGITPPL